MINLVILYSALERKNQVNERTSAEIKKIKFNLGEIKFTGFINDLKTAEKAAYETKDEYSGTILFIASGGTEALISKFAKILTQPVILLSSAAKNSLAASLEAYAVLKKSCKIKLLYYNNVDEILPQLKIFSVVCSAINKINNSKFGLIGKPSDWLLTSAEINHFGAFDTELVKYEIDELIKEIDNAPEEEADGISAELKRSYGSVDVPDSSLLDSSRVYLGVNKIIETGGLSSVSIRCFDLLEHGYTACTAVSMCNDEGITAGCEGDLQATFSAMIANYMLGKPGWMANPSVIDPVDNTLVLAHCTIPSKMLSDLSRSGLTTHMESGISTANRGPLYKRDVTVFRVGGNFDKLVAVRGEILESDMKYPSLCRTQVRLKLKGDINDWIENTVGNHQILVYGNLVEHLKDFCRFTGIEYIGIGN